MKTNALASLAAVLMLLSATTSQAEEKGFDEYGKPSEMKALTNVYLDTGVNLEARENFIRQAASRTRNIEWLESIEDAELIIQWVEEGVSATVYVLRVKESGRLRLLWRSSDSKTSRWTLKVSTVLARRFATVYNQAQSSK